MTHIAHLEYDIMSFQIVTLNLSHCELHPRPQPTQPIPPNFKLIPNSISDLLFQLFSKGLEVFVLASICPLCWDSQPPGESSTAKMGLLGVTLTQHNEHLPACSMMLTMFGERTTIPSLGGTYWHWTRLLARGGLHTQHNEQLLVSMMFTIFRGWATYCVMRCENTTFHVSRNVRYYVRNVIL